MAERSALAELAATFRVRNDSARTRGFFASISGGSCYLLDPRGSDIRLEDIAIVLSRIPRFGGHTTPAYCDAYSVAQHSVLVSTLCSPEHALIGLLHDATEAYLGDVISPLKRQLGEAYASLERSWALAIGERFGLGDQLASLPEDVLLADLTALEVERHDLLERGEGWSWWGSEARPLVCERLWPMGSVEARRLFEERFAALDRDQEAGDASR